jgi:hypothetical protein
VAVPAGSPKVQRFFNAFTGMFPKTDLDIGNQVP